MSTKGVSQLGVEDRALGEQSASPVILTEGTKPMAAAVSAKKGAGAMSRNAVTRDLHSPKYRQRIVNRKGPAMPEAEEYLSECDCCGPDEIWLCGHHVVRHAQRG
jgi:hypothetical protein